MCLPKNEFIKEFNSAELARWKIFTSDLALDKSCRDTVILKNMRTVAYNGRMGKVVRVEGTRTVVRLLPDGQILSVPTANVSGMKNCLSIFMVNDLTMKIAARRALECFAALALDALREIYRHIKVYCKLFCVRTGVVPLA